MNLFNGRYRRGAAVFVSKKIVNYVRSNMNKLQKLRNTQIILKES